MRNPRSFLLNSVVAAAVLVFVFRLSASGRTVVDWIVVALVIAAIAWNLWGLGRRLHDLGGGRAVHHEVRTVGFWIVGLMNTVWAVPGAEGTWKWWVGVVLLVLAAGDTIALYRKEQRAVGARA